MYDQADELRRLVRQNAPVPADGPDTRPRQIVVVGGKGGVGTTTVAVNLAVALAQHRRRTLLVDADPRGGDVAVLCRLDDGETTADVLAARRTVQEVLQPGPGGIQVLPGAWASEPLANSPTELATRLIQPLEGLGERFEFVVLDAGSGANPLARLCSQAADATLMVTTAELPSVMDGYATIKLLAADCHPARISSLVNMAPNSAAARDVHNRLARACRRFLAVDLHSAGYLPSSPEAVSGSAAGEPFVIAATACPAARQLRRLAESLGTTVVSGQWPVASGQRRREYEAA